MSIRPFDRDARKHEFHSAAPFPHVVIDDFLDPDFAREVVAAYPTFEQAREQGFEFDFVRERRKIQISDRARFPEPVARLNDALASPEFIEDLVYITGIENLESDPSLGGGGIHVTGPGGRLDVHVDFNYNEERDVYRRLNLLVYLNPRWEESWGGQVDLWDRDVRECHQSVLPVLNRCVLFQTSEISYHGVRPVSADAPAPRQSFATYYYTKDPAAGWDAEPHSTIFRTRPNERLRRHLIIPAERLYLQGRRFVRALANSLRGSG
ncbi:MAG: hypothetical protein CL908_12430 [Deltaproteobacteria bacterium]|nr:hypothetical protein [Deltaproteobacteria bacterium]